ncbi:hypothetical protein [Streptomyces sp. NPDC050856]|uniref:hypothetical protein n=1 Tax=Streptomyces sp. NPDC050856 TaxID=3154939 RepID=UPI0033E92F48
MLPEFAVLLSAFRRSVVVVPIDPYGSLWTAEQGGVRWICAFSGEERLGRFARARAKRTARGTTAPYSVHGCSM